MENIFDLKVKIWLDFDKSISLFAILDLDV